MFTLGPADYGADLLATVREDSGSATGALLAGPDDLRQPLNYTGGTTGKSKGALRHAPPT